MTREALVVRARGLSARRAVASGSPSAVEDMLRERATSELAILRRWDAGAIAVLELDEDRQTLRTVARGIVAGVPAARRTLGAIATASLPRAVIASLADASSFAAVHAALAEHPLAAAFLAEDLFDVEHGLARRVADLARSRDRALAEYLAASIDVANAQAALALSLRGGELPVESLFLPRGRRVDRALFVAAAGSRDTAASLLARAFDGTPVGAALFAGSPAAIDDAALAWQRDTQARLRRLEPLGLAAVVGLVLQRRDEARRARAAVWSEALGGAG